MQEARTPAQEAAEDLFFGQAVIIWARWFLIVGLLVLALSNTGAEDIILSALVVAIFMAMNFFVHSRYLMQQPANQNLTSLVSFIDLVLITVIVLFWPGKRGLESDYFVFYYPMVLAFGFVFPRRLEITYTVVAIIAYGGACLLLAPSILTEAIAGGVITGAENLETLVLRLIVLGATGGLANYYFRILRARRRAALPGAVGIGQLPSAS